MIADRMKQLVEQGILNAMHERIKLDVSVCTEAGAVFVQVRILFDGQVVAESCDHKTLPPK